MEDLNHKIACEALKKGARNMKFTNSLIKNLSVTYQQLMDEAYKYICMDEEVHALREDEKASLNKTQKLERRSHKNERRSYLVSWARDD